jgi:prepilin peptidase CpaA
MDRHLAVDAFLVACIVAGYFDLRFRRIPNALTYGALIVTLAATAFAGLTATVIAFVTFAIVILAGSVLHGRGWIGGGDIKLLGVGAAAFGVPACFAVGVAVALAGGVLSVVVALRERRLRAVLETVKRSAFTGTPVIPQAGYRRIPYALAIAAGSYGYVASESVGTWLHLAR